MTMSMFKAPQPSLPGKDRPNAGERGHVKLTDVQKLATVKRRITAEICTIFIF